MKTLLIVILSVVGTLGLLGGAAALFKSATGVVSPGVPGQNGTPIPVRTERATRGALVEIVSVPGEVQPEPQLRVPISARVAARIIDLPFKEWDTVTKGNPKANPPVPPSVLVRLDAKDLEATLRSVKARYAAQEAEVVVTQAHIDSQKAQIAASEVELKDAERDLARQKDLLESKDVSQSIVDTAQTKVDELLARLTASKHDLVAAEQELVVLQHNLVAAEAEVAKAQEDLNYTVITSPIDGMVTRLRMKVGELAVVGVENSSLTNIMEVADLSKMVMLARVDENNVAALKVGQHATVRMQAYKNETFEGTVESIPPALADTNRGGFFGGEDMAYFEVRIRLELKGRRIYSGLSADADIETSRHEGVKVPSQCVLGRPLDSLPDEIRKSPAVQRDKAVASVVFRLANGKAVATPVVVGPSDETQTLITQGLDEGAEVISGPYKVLDTLQNDQKVTKQESPATTQSTAKPTTSATSTTAPTTKPSRSP